MPALGSTAARAWIALVPLLAGAAPADEPTGGAIYQEHCQRCHGVDGAGTPDVPGPLAGDRSLNQLAAYIDATMPEDDPARVTGDAARQVAAYVHETFYSAVARDRSRPARIEFQRLTVRQYRSVLADVVGSFRPPAPPADDTLRGLTGAYFADRNFRREKGLVFERTDPRIDFDFGTLGPDPERIDADEFAIRWSGGIVPAETGVHEFTIRTAHSARLWINVDEGRPATIDAYVKSGDETEHRASVYLLGGRVHPLWVQFSKANQGVDNQENQEAIPAGISLLWKPPHGSVEIVPERVLVPHAAHPVFTVATAFPPDDRSLGYDRGAGVSPEWFTATTAAAVETADHVLDRLPELAGVTRDAPDRESRLREFAATFAARAFRRPLDESLRELVVDRAFAGAADPDTGFRRSLLAILGSPRFLFREPADADPFSTAARLSFGLWDSIPDEALLTAASEGRLTTPAEIRGQAERMTADRRTRAKLRDFLFAWLRVDLGPELVKDPTRYPEFTRDVAADLRTSLEILLEEVAVSSGDFRRLFTTDEVPLNGRLAPLYGVTLPADADFTTIRLDEGRRGGVLSHPYVMSVLSYPGSSSPIHRGVFLARTVLGNVLKPPRQAVAPLAAEQAPDLTTRERVAAQTAATACQSCHTMINPLGFALEEFDAIGRYRSVERVGDLEKPVNASGSYTARAGPSGTFTGARELGTYCGSSHDAQEAFVQALFHAVVKQPVRAWGPDALAGLHAAFERGGFDIRRLLVDIMEVAAMSPVAAGGDAEPLPDADR